MKEKIKEYFRGLGVLLRSMPPAFFALFVLALFTMNLLANKSIDLQFEWLALDCGIIVSWFIFLAMDSLTKHFGPRAATQISIIATFFNLVGCGVLFLGSLIPGSWSEGGANLLINHALDKTFGGSWYVIFGSTLAFAVSAAVNNFTNFAVGKGFKKNPDGLLAYIIRAYVSTALGQFVDNLVFSLIVSRIFFGWSFIQCLGCAIAGMLAELLFEAVFSYFGYRICESFKKNGVGKEYLDYISAQKESLR